MKKIQLISFLLLAIAVSGCVTPSPKNFNQSQFHQMESLYARYKRDLFPKVDDVTVSEAVSMIEEKEAVLVDIRTEEEQNVSSISGSITLEDFERSFDNYQNYPVIFYCTIGGRSGVSATHFLDHDVYNLKGGVLAWAHDNRAFVKEGRDTHKVHVYAEKWNLLPEGYEAVVFEEE